MGVSMKGKRKAKTTKWLLKGQFEAEARHILANRSRNASHRFLNVAFTFGVEHEPVGLLAGSPLVPHRVGRGI
jgi:myo-inositol-1(or 4)-monophosphatase